MEQPHSNPAGGLVRDWFDALQPREQLYVAAAGVVVVFALLYFLLWLPLGSQQAELRSSIATWQQSLAELRPLKAAVQNDGNGNPRQAGAGQSLVVIVDSTLTQYGLSSALQRSQPVGQTGIRVEFENAAFDDLVRWLGALGSGYGLQVESGTFSVSAQSVPGRVNASLTLQR